MHRFPLRRPRFHAGIDGAPPRQTRFLQGDYSFDIETLADVVLCAEVGAYLDYHLWLVDPDGGASVGAWRHRSRGQLN